MFPQMRQIQRLVVEGQSAQDERVGVDGFAKGIGRVVSDDDLGCEESRVWEYRHTGQLHTGPNM